MNRRIEKSEQMPHIRTPCAVEVWHSFAFSKIRFATCVWWGQSFARKTTTTDEFLLSLAADSGVDANDKHNNQPNKRFNKHLGRASMRLWVDWVAVALLVFCFSSAALFRAVQQRLIVVMCPFSCSNRPMKLKLSHEQRVGVGQPRECSHCDWHVCSGQERGSPW